MAQRSDLASLLSLLDDEDETVAVNAMAELLNREAELGDALAVLQESDHPLLRPPQPPAAGGDYAAPPPPGVRFPAERAPYRPDRRPD